MAEYFPSGRKRMFRHKVVVPCTRAAQTWTRASVRAAQKLGPDPDLAPFLEYVDSEELGGRYKYSAIRPAPANKSHHFEVQFFFSNDKAALAFKIRFG
jgi:hypothetical protein